MKALVAVFRKFKTERHSLIELKLYASNHPIVWWNRFGNPTPAQVVMNHRELMHWNGNAKLLQEVARSGALKGWDVEKEVSVVACGNKVYSLPFGLVFKFTKPDDLDVLLAEGPRTVVYKPSILE
ncbi:hypothetical protein CLCR_11021 [Cladophialophora carrionii]|uniref:Uncharacterized protein n=1 Tax=Cladophialophora carrionii TaxID=86049 RepID=A0A1C1CZ63_9EURO|nr:hypothetical protein CLCR_11021 [Cladophialophora carrionii]